MVPLVGHCNVAEACGYGFVSDEDLGGPNVVQLQQCTVLHAMLDNISDAAVGTYVFGCTHMWQRALNGTKANLMCRGVQLVKTPCGLFVGCYYGNLTAHQPFSSQQRCILLPITKNPTSPSTTDLTQWSAQSKNNVSITPPNNTHGTTFQYVYQLIIQNHTSLAALCRDDITPPPNWRIMAHYKVLLRSKVRLELGEYLHCSELSFAEKLHVWMLLFEGFCLVDDYANCILQSITHLITEYTL